MSKFVWVLTVITMFVDATAAGLAFVDENYLAGWFFFFLAVFFMVAAAHFASRVFPVKEKAE